MKGVVTNRQIFFILLLTISMDSFTHIPRDAIKAAGTGAWFSIALLTIIFAIGVFFFASLNKKFSGKTMFEYSKILIGKPGAYIISFIYSIFFLVVLIVLSKDIAKFIKGEFLHLTPLWALVLLGLCMGVYISTKGITNIGRLGEIYGVLLIIVALSVHTVMFFLGDIRYIKPFFEANQLKLYIGGMKDLIFPFLGIEILTIMPFDKVQNKKGVFYSVLAVFFIGVFYIIVAETSTMIVGINDIVMYDGSLVEALRETKLPSFFVLERVDLLFLTVGIAAITCGYCAVFCGVADNAMKIIPKIKRNLLLIIIGIIAFSSSIFVINDKTQKLLVTIIIPVCGIITSLIIPITLFIISKVKKYEN